VILKTVLAFGSFDILHYGHLQFLRKARALGDRLSEFRYQQLNVIVLLDDADQASRPVLAQMTRLLQHDSSPESRLTLVLAGRQTRMGRLGSHLLEMAELRIDLLPWEETDTAIEIEEEEDAQPTNRPTATINPARANPRAKRRQNPGKTSAARAGS
jgi:cytidyltransferase-like protein